MSWWAARLTVVRGFATYLHTLDPATEVPPTDLLPDRSHRAVPYLYSDDDIIALMAAAKILRSPLRVLTYQTLIALVAVTGVHIGEAIRLDRHDLDFDDGVLTARFSKFDKSRELPLHVSTLDASTPISGGGTSCIPGQRHRACSSHGGHPAAGLQGALDLPPPGARCQSPATLDGLSAAPGRSASQLRHPHRTRRLSGKR